MCSITLGVTLEIPLNKSPQGMISVVIVVVDVHVLLHLNRLYIANFTLLNYATPKKTRNTIATVMLV